MEIHASISQKVYINPENVIEKLIEEELGGAAHRNWVFEKDGKYYHGYEGGGGSHSWDEEEPISKEKYDYVVALKLVKEYLSKKKIK
ncbi:MAG: hypothetical protein ACYC5G_05045 [Candidatus Doudnabacteria bacterium]